MLETLFFKLLEISIQASFFVLAIIFIRLCFKRLPKRYVCILWALVALRLLLPVQITSAFSLVPDTSRVQSWAESETPDNITANAPSAGNVIINMDTPAQGSASVNTAAPQTGNTSAAERVPQTDDVPGAKLVLQEGKTPVTEPAPQDDMSSTGTSGNTDSTVPVTLNIPLLLASFWCAGMCVLLGFGLISYLRIRRQLREAVHDTDNIWYCDRIPSPFVMGYVKPRIYIPFSIAQEQLPYIIAHEKSHIAHFDHLGKLLGYVLLCVYWFNPFVWAAYVLYCKDLELACDERVINTLGDSERKPYSEALLMCSVSNKAFLQSPLAFSETAIRERILNILNYKKPGFRGIVLAVTVCVIAAVCFMTSPKKAEEEPEGVLEVISQEEALDFLRERGFSYWSDKLLEEGKISSADELFCNDDNYDLNIILTFGQEDTLHYYYYTLDDHYIITLYHTAFTCSKETDGVYLYSEQYHSFENVTTAGEAENYPSKYFSLEIPENNEDDLNLAMYVSQSYKEEYEKMSADERSQFALANPETALPMLMHFSGGSAECLPYDGDYTKLVIYTFADGSRIVYQMNRFHTDTTSDDIGCFWFPILNWEIDFTERLQRGQEFISKLTINDLSSVTKEYSGQYNYASLPDTITTDNLYILDEISEQKVTLYGLSDGSSMILKDGNSLYPLYMNWIGGYMSAPELFKGDYDGDGVDEYALTTIDGTGTGVSVTGLTILDVSEGTIETHSFRYSDILYQFQNISYEYLPDEHALSIRASNQHVLLNVEYIETDRETTFEKLSWGSIVNFEERDGQWWVILEAGVVTKDTPSPQYECGAVFSAPVIYGKNHTFQTGDIVIEPVNYGPEVQQQADILSTYADQLNAFPGDCKMDENGNLVSYVSATDYECFVTTSSYTGETVYHWTTTTTRKSYPLEIKDGKVQDVPARIITEDELRNLSFGEELIRMTYKAHPYGTKQYILRENGILHVNIGYEYDEFINLQYLEFQISADKQTAELTNYGKGYYLLAINDVSGLETFRETFTGEGHMIPSDSTHLPWRWLLTLNDETFDKPQLKAEDIHTIEHLWEYPYTWNNITDFYCGFVAAELREYGELFTEYHYRDDTDDIVIVTDRNGSVTHFTHNGVEKTLPLKSHGIYSGNGATYSYSYFEDVTGDGQREFIVEESGGGTGYRESECYVFNLDTMEQLLFDKNISHITSQLKVTLTEFNTVGNLHYTIEYNGQTLESDMGFDPEKEEHAEILKEGVTLEDANRYFSFNPSLPSYTEASIIDYNRDRQCFELKIYIWTNNTWLGQYIGALSADYIWDAEAGQFIIDLDTVVLETY